MHSTHQGRAMLSLTPAQDELEKKQKKDKVELCGKNRGPHDYIPIEWSITKTSKRVTRLLCRTCFVHVSVGEIVCNYSSASLL